MTRPSWRTWLDSRDPDYEDPRDEESDIEPAHDADGVHPDEAAYEGTTRYHHPY